MFGAIRVFAFTVMLLVPLEEAVGAAQYLEPANNKQISTQSTTPRRDFSVLLELKKEKERMNPSDAETIRRIFRLEKTFASLISIKLEDVQEWGRLLSNQCEADIANQTEAARCNLLGTLKKFLEQPENAHNPNRPYLMYLQENIRYFDCRFNGDGFHPECRVNFQRLEPIKQSPIGQEEKFIVVRDDLVSTVEACDGIGEPSVGPGFGLGDARGDSPIADLETIVKAFSAFVTDSELFPYFVQTSTLDLTLAKVKKILKECLDRDLDSFKELIFFNTHDANHPYKSPDEDPDFFKQEIAKLQKKTRENYEDANRKIEASFQAVSLKIKQIHQHD